MTQLRSLEVRCVSEDHTDELYFSVMKLSMLGKLSLTLEMERARVRRSYNFSNSLMYENLIFHCLESFSAPPLLQTLELVRRLIEMYVWLGSMENLTTLRLCYSHIFENLTTILQFLPNLKYL